MKIRWISTLAGLCALGFTASILSGDGKPGTAAPTKILGVLLDEKCSPNSQTRVVSPDSTRISKAALYGLILIRGNAL